MQINKHFIELKTTDNGLYRAKEVRFLPGKLLQPGEAQFVPNRPGPHSPHSTLGKETPPRGPGEGTSHPGS